MFDLVFALTCLEYGVAVDLGGELWGVEEEEEKEEIEEGGEEEKQKQKDDEE